MRRLLFIVSLLAALPGEAKSQMPASLGPGQVVRVTMRAGPRYVAVIDSVRGDTLIIRPRRPPGSVALKFGLPAIDILEVQSGHRSRVKTAAKRAGLGLAGGAALGALMAVVWSSQSPECEVRTCPSAGQGAQAGGAAGLAIGLVSGLTSPSEVWQGLDLPGRPAVGVNALRGGRVGVGLSLLR